MQERCMTRRRVRSRGGGTEHKEEKESEDTAAEEVKEEWNEDVKW